jgi:S1-C subfamily serine protease
MGSVSYCFKRSALLMTSALLATALPPRMPLAALDLDELFAPVIALEARIPSDARSAATLGTVRGGTGVVIDGAGLVLTVGYLILEAEAVDLLPNGLAGGRVPADVVAWDEITGLGLLRSRQNLGIAPMPLGSSAALGAGDAVIVVGWERIDAMLPAVVSERNRYAGYWEYMIEDALYVSPSHPAFPGAALVSLDGKLAGIGAFAHTDPVDAYALAGTVFIPIDALKPVLADLLLAGRSAQPRGWLGLYCEEIEGALRVRRLPDDGPALRAGIQPGDYVLALGSTPVTTLADFYRHLWSTTRPGDRVSITLGRGSDSLTVEVEAMDRYEHYRPRRTRP